MPSNVLNSIKNAGKVITSIFGEETSVWEAVKSIPSAAVTKVSACGDKCKALIKTYFPSAAEVSGDPKKITIKGLFGIFSDFGKFYENKDSVREAALQAALGEIGFVDVSEEGGSDETDGEELSIPETSNS